MFPIAYSSPSPNAPRYTAANRTPTLGPRFANANPTDPTPSPIDWDAAYQQLSLRTAPISKTTTQPLNKIKQLVHLQGPLLNVQLLEALIPQGGKVTVCPNPHDPIVNTALWKKGSNQTGYYFELADFRRLETGGFAASRYKIDGETGCLVEATCIPKGTKAKDPANPPEPLPVRTVLATLGYRDQHTAQ